MAVIEFSAVWNRSYNHNPLDIYTNIREIPVESQGYKGVFYTHYNGSKQVVSFELENAKGNEIYQLSVHNVDNDIKLNSLEAQRDSCLCVFPSSNRRYKFTCIVKFGPIDSPINEIIQYCRINPELMLTFKCPDGETSAPILLMSARSPVIHAMMNSDCIEAKTRIIKIKDFSIKVIRKMIEFCQTNTIMDTAEVEIELAKIADKYDIKLMKSYTGNLLIKNISSDNVILFYQFSQNYNIDTLATSCISFASENFIKVISSTDATNVDDDVLKKFWIEIHNEMKKNEAKQDDRPKSKNIRRGNAMF